MSENAGLAAQLVAKPDRRRARTRQALTRAFAELVREQGFDAMTVAAVADRANVGRSTIYEHFDGLPDLLRASLQHPMGGLAAMLAAGRAAEEFVPLMLHFWEARQYGRAMLAGPARPWMVHCLADLLEPYVAAADGALPRRLLALQMAEAQLGLLAHWLEGRVAVSAEVMAGALFRSARALAGG